MKGRKRWMELCALLCGLLLGMAQQIGAEPSAQQKHAIGYEDTPMLPGGKWHVHDGRRQQPAKSLLGEELNASEVIDRGLPDDIADAFGLLSAGKYPFDALIGSSETWEANFPSEQVDSALWLQTGLAAHPSLNTRPGEF